MLFDLSRRIAMNRVIAGLHYELDNDAGVTAAEACFKLLKEGKEFGKLVVAARTESLQEGRR